jgi:hypothetical protein
MTFLTCTSSGHNYFWVANVSNQKVTDVKIADILAMNESPGLRRVQASHILAAGRHWQAWRPLAKDTPAGPCKCQVRVHAERQTSCARNILCHSDVFII